MKIRSDFVTNSSSSSFIIASKTKPPIGYEKDCTELNKDNLAELLCQYDYYINEETLIEAKEIGGFSDTQIGIIKTIVHGNFDVYSNIIKRMDNNELNYYRIFVDRDWLYNNPILENFIYGSEIIDKETDL